MFHTVITTLVIFRRLNKVKLLMIIKVRSKVMNTVMTKIIANQAFINVSLVGIVYQNFQHYFNKIKIRIYLIHYASDILCNDICNRYFHIHQFSLFFTVSFIVLLFSERYGDWVSFSILDECSLYLEILSSLYQFCKSL